MKCYAMYDMTAKRDNPGHGFANSKGVLAFSTKAKMEFFIQDRTSWDFSCKRVSYKVALKNLEPVYGGPDMGLWIDGIPNANNDPEMVVLKPSRY